MPKRVPFGISNYSDHIGTSSNKYSNLQSLDLMGYDWIAGMMENKSKEAQLDQPQEYFEELEKFRRQNKQFCISTENRQSSNNAFYTHQSNYKKAFNDFNYHFQPSNDESLTQCDEKQPAIYAYTLNERLFPIPLDIDTAQRGVPDPNNPHIIKISIPSNRFLHRNHKVQTMKEKTMTTHDSQSDGRVLGESLSLSSHCQQARGGTMSTTLSSQRRTIADKKCSHQEPASLRGHILMDSVNNGDVMIDSLSPFGGNQPRSEQEAIDQLRRGKTGAKFSRMVPSVLVNRSLNLESVPDSINICQTRITLRDMDDSRPRSPMKSLYNNDNKFSNEPINTTEEENSDILCAGVPRASLSRQQMSKVYGDAMKTVWENAE